MPFANQVAVITGASSGIGWALAEELARRGCRLGLIARRRDLLDQLAVKLRATGTVVEVAAADVADREKLLQAFAELRAKLGPTDLLIANAGVLTPVELEPQNVPAQLDSLRVNLFGVIVAVEAVLPDMLARKSGHIAAVSSVAAFNGLPGSGAYCAGKAAVNTYLTALRIQLHGRGIGVTVLCPGFVRTPMVEVNKFPMPMMLEPVDAARRMVRAIERRKKVYGFPWPMAALVKFSRWLPDWVMARARRE
jgi:short-subunit dehydrogenase